MTTYIIKPKKLSDLLEIYYFYISQTNLSFDKIFYKVVYHHIISMCDFFCESRQLFCRGLHEFSQRLWFVLDTFPSTNPQFPQQHAEYAPSF